MKGASADCAPASLPSEHPLFILYTSGTTGKPKGVVHTTGGYLLGAHLTTKLVFDLHEDDVYWCTADIGWVTGHSYVVYGPLSNGATSVMYEGAPDFPEKDRFWSIIERHKVSIFYTAPTAIRAFVRWGDEHAQEARPVVAAAARQRRRADQPRGVDVVPRGHRRRPLPDRRHLVADGDGRHHDDAAAGHHRRPSRAAARARSSASTPQVVKRDGTPCKPNEGGFLVIKKPWPSMLRGVHGDPERYKKSYWSEIPGVYFTGDGSRQDEDGFFWVMGRVDDVLNVAGHRLGTAEIESALVSHPQVAEAAVVGPPHELKGQAIFAFVTLKAGVDGVAPRSRRRSRTTSPRRSAPWRAPTRSASPTRSPRPARARSCAASSGRSRPAASPRAT